MIWVGTSGYNYPEWKGSFYPQTLPAAKMLPVLRGAVSDRRDQLHVLPRAEREDSPGVGRGDAGTVQADAEGAEADHARRAAARLRRSRAPVPRDGGDPRAEARRAAVSAAAESEEGHRAVRRISRGVSAARLRRVRVPPRVVARRGDLRPAARAQPGAVRGRQREALDAGGGHGGLRLLPATRRGVWSGGYRALGAT